ncbi:MAG TPA: biotin/lipoyl-containing protein, partial [Candidatus Limnocylindrales bacterium]
MARPILMPKPGQMTEECTLILWRKAVGDPVHRGDVLFEIETDKSTMEVETFEEGVLLTQVVAEGETVPVNAVCGWIGQPGEAIPEMPTPAAPAPAPTQAPAPAPVSTTSPSASAAAAPAPAAPASPAPATAAAPAPTTTSAAPAVAPSGSGAVKIS